ncbi:MAG: hypothetical protein K6B72_02425 [Lachnospiraceae bacterium]|nr:hypothetical protein [Lachnospiraceae bacterium]
MKSPGRSTDEQRIIETYRAADSEEKSNIVLLLDGYKAARQNVKDAISILCRAAISGAAAVTAGTSERETPRAAADPNPAPRLSDEAAEAIPFIRTSGAGRCDRAIDAAIEEYDRRAYRNSRFCSMTAADINHLVEISQCNIFDAVYMTFKAAAVIGYRAGKRKQKKGR